MEGTASASARRSSDVHRGPVERPVEAFDHAEGVSGRVEEVFGRAAKV